MTKKLGEGDGLLSLEELREQVLEVVGSAFGECSYAELIHIEELVLHYQVSLAALGVNEADFQRLKETARLSYISRVNESWQLEKWLLDEGDLSQVDPSLVISGFVLLELDTLALPLSEIGISKEECQEMSRRRSEVWAWSELRRIEQGPSANSSMSLPDIDRFIEHVRSSRRSLQYYGVTEVDLEVWREVYVEARLLGYLENLRNYHAHSPEFAADSVREGVRARGLQLEDFGTNEEELVRLVKANYWNRGFISVRGLREERIARPLSSALTVPSRGLIETIIGWVHHAGRRLVDLDVEEDHLVEWKNAQPKFELLSWLDSLRDPYWTVDAASVSCFRDEVRQRKFRLRDLGTSEKELDSLVGRPGRRGR